MNESEKLKLELEKERLNKSWQIQKEELLIRKEELELRKKESEKGQVPKKLSKTILTKVIPTIVVAILGLLGTWYTAYNQGKTSLELEKSKFESSLILKVIETGNRERSKLNLIFLYENGLVSDPDGRILTKLKNDQISAPVLLPKVQQRKTGKMKEVEIKVEGSQFITASIVNINGALIELKNNSARLLLEIGVEISLNCNLRGLVGFECIIRIWDPIESKDIKIYRRTISKRGYANVIDRFYLD